MTHKFGILLLAAAALSGCAATVKYGAVPHSQFASDPRCANDPAQSAAIEPVSDKLFFATSRLPDCRAPNIVMTNFRSPRVLFGRFALVADSTKKSKKPIERISVDISGEAGWWSALEAKAAAHRGRVLVYVHGFRETFESSSKSAIQIQRLTEFAGPVIEYSWPSQGRLLGYLVDETNVHWDEANFRRFLSKLATQPWVKEIVLVSHSMGARLVLPAVEFVDRTSSNADASNISNIILASPDIDKEDFERNITEEILSARRVNNDRRITIYSSRRDSALSISQRLHGYPRLGSPYCFSPFEAAALKAKGLPVRCYAAKSAYDVPPQKSGLTIIDTTDVSKTGSGHSDFLTSAPTCADFKAVAGGEVDRKAGRVATNLSYVFALNSPANLTKAQQNMLCRVP